MTLEEEKDFASKKLRRYTTSALKSLSPSNTERDLIDEGVRFRVLRMTIPENWTDMANLGRALTRQDLEQFSASAPRAREHALKAAVRELSAIVFSDQPTFVKINAALLLGRLTIENANITAKKPPVPYFPGCRPVGQDPRGLEATFGHQDPGGQGARADHDGRRAAPKTAR